MIVIRINFFLWALGLGVGYGLNQLDGFFTALFLLLFYTFVLSPLVSASGLWLRSFDVDDEHGL